MSLLFWRSTVANPLPNEKVTQRTFAWSSKRLTIDSTCNEAGGCGGRGKCWVTLPVRRSKMSKPSVVATQNVPSLCSKVAVITSPLKTRRVAGIGAYSELSAMSPVQAGPALRGSRAKAFPRCPD